MTCWTTLEIKPTTNTNDIKRAYSKLLKESDPEADPIKYENLKNAYNKAILLAKTSINEFSNKLNTSSNSEFLNSLSRYSNDTINMDNPINNFLKKVDSIYKTSYCRFSKQSWIELLQDPVLLQLDILPDIEKALINYLILNKYIPHDVYLILNNFFHWTERQNELSELFPSSSINTLLSLIKNPDQLSYDYLYSIDNKDLDYYLKLRETIYTNFNNPNFSNLEDYLLKAYKIYSNDVELLRLLGDYYLKKSDTIRAMKYFREALAINKNDLYSTVQFGHLLVDSKQYSSAIPYLEKYLLNNNISLNTTALLDLAESYYYSYNFVKARSIFIILEKLRPDLQPIKNFLDNIDMKIDTSLPKSTDVLNHCIQYINSKYSPFVTKLNSIYNNFNLRINLDSWENLLKLPIFSDKSLYYLLEFKLIEFLTTNKFIPNIVFILFSNYFSWKNKISDLKRIYPTLNISFLLYKIDEVMPLSYDYLANINSDKLLDYLELREIASKHVSANLLNSKEYLDKALNLYDQDYELYKLYGEFYLNNNLKDEAITSFTKASELSNDEYYCNSLLASLLIPYKRYNEALKYLNKALNSSNNSMLLYNKSFLFQYAICLYYTKDLPLAKKYFAKLITIDKDYPFASEYLENITLRLNRKTRKILDFSSLSNEETPIDKTNLPIATSTSKIIIVLFISIFIFTILMIFLFYKKIL